MQICSQISVLLMLKLKYTHGRNVGGTLQLDEMRKKVEHFRNLTPYSFEKYEFLHNMEYN